MATQDPIDVSVGISPRLSNLIESRVNDPDAEEPATLGSVREYLLGLMPAGFKEAERMHRFDVGESLIDEMNTLIERFGSDALAADFVRSAGSEPLSRVIESVMNDENRENPPTLGTIRQALVDGLGARLIGEGVIDEDEDDGLLAEIEALIEHYGEDVLAEDLVRYE